jgi:hypothetical protein
MEAAGVEPASERPVTVDHYVRSCACDFAPLCQAPRKREGLARSVSSPDAGLTGEPAC